MALDTSTFETISPSRFISFTFPNPNTDPIFPHQLLRVAVLDSPIQSNDSPQVAAMFVPKHRESDWIFSTQSGHLQLLLSSPQISRLILIGNQPCIGDISPIVYHRSMNTDTFYQERLEESLKPLVIALSPKSCFKNGIPEIPILSYEDDILCSVVLEKSVGSFVGEMLVEDVEVESGSEVGNCRQREFRRRLRFKRMPNLVQTEIRIMPETGLDLNSIKFEEVEFRPDIGVLVHVYLGPMVASLSLIGSRIEERIQSGFRPKALCIGVGGGALLVFLRNQLGFEVVGVEMDEEVLRVARQYFGLKDDEFIRLLVGDAIEYIDKHACRDSKRNLGSLGTHEVGNGCYMDDGYHFDAKYDVVMVDLDSSDARNGISAPPSEFVRKDVLLAAKSILYDFGIFVVNVIPPNRLFYKSLIQELRKVFCELYEIDVGNGENFVLVGTVLPVVSSISYCENAFLKKLKMVISGTYMDSVRKI